MWIRNNLSSDYGLARSRKHKQDYRLISRTQLLKCWMFVSALLVGSLLITPVESDAQTIAWRKANGPYASVNFLAVSPQGILFAAAPKSSAPFSNLLFRSSDGGADWVRADSGFVIYDSLRSMTFAPTGAMFICTQSNLFASTNSGHSWFITPLFSGGRALAADSSGILYVGGGGEGVWKSTAAVPTYNDWERGGMGLITVNCLAALSHFRLVAGTVKGILFSPDSAHTWITTNVGDVNVTKFVRISDGYLFAASSDSGVFRSTDSGKTWSTVNSGLPGGNIGSLTSGPEGYLYATVSGKGIYQSRDDGNSWHAINGNLANLFAKAILVTGDSTIFVGTSGGIYGSTNGGKTWEQEQSA